MAEGLNANGSEILEAAVELAATIGVAGVGPRPLLAHKGVHRSAVNYHFGQRARLMELVFAEILERRRGRLSVAIETLAQQPSHFLSMPAFLAAHHGVASTLENGFDAFLVEVNSHPDLFSENMEAVQARDIECCSALWRDAAVRLDRPINADIWFLLSSGFSSFSVLSETAVERIMILPQLAWRLADRLERRGIRPLAHAPDVEEASIEHTLYDGVPLMVMTGTAELLLSRKPTTLRAIAGASGVPLSTIKYLFPQTETIISGAYRMIHKRVFGDVDPSLSIRGALSMGQPYDCNGIASGVTIAIQTLASLVARNPKLGSLGREMRQLRGAMAERQLVHNGVAADRLDGLLWTCLTAGTTTEALARPPTERAAWVKHRQDHLASAVFGL